MSDDLGLWLQSVTNRVNSELDQVLGSHLTSSRLLEAARYSVLGGGKRLRPALVYAAAAAAGASLESADACAVSVELVHTYSLIHDDLPCMDDDALRRGRPTTHIAFDEATAVLAGDALQALAFSVLSKKDRRSDAMRVKQLKLLGDAVGFTGMALGQATDLASEGRVLELNALRFMHEKKTGVLIAASMLMGASCGSTNSDSWKALAEAGRAIGLAFQIRDDILDETTPTKLLGKEQGRDQALGKSTFPRLLGLDNSLAEARRLVAEAHLALAQLDGDTRFLKYLATQSVERSH